MLKLMLFLKPHWCLSGKWIPLIVLLVQFVPCSVRASPHAQNLRCRSHSSKKCTRQCLESRAQGPCSVWEFGSDNVRGKASSTPESLWSEFRARKVPGAWSFTGELSLLLWHFSILWEESVRRRDETDWRFSFLVTFSLRCSEGIHLDGTWEREDFRGIWQPLGDH